MPSRDARLSLDCIAAVRPQSIGGAVNGLDIDLQGAEAALIFLSNGAATTPATVKIQESATGGGSGYTDVADSDLIGLTGNTSGVAQTASTVAEISYVGSKRFIRVITTAGTAALFSADVIRAHLRHGGSQPV
jgi:hypothetical protein